MTEDVALTVIKDLMAEYGPWAILLFVVWIERKRILDGILSFLGQFWPSIQSFADKRADRAARQEKATMQERTDTINALKELISAYRHELDESKHERVMLQNRLLELMAGSAKREAQLVATLRDISDAITHHSHRLVKVETCLEFLVEQKEDNNHA